MGFKRLQRGNTSFQAPFETAQISIYGEAAKTCGSYFKNKKWSRA